MMTGESKGLQVSGFRHSFVFFVKPFVPLCLAVFSTQRHEEVTKNTEKKIAELLKLHRNDL